LEQYLKYCSWGICYNTVH